MLFLTVRNRISQNLFLDLLHQYLLIPSVILSSFIFTTATTTVSISTGLETPVKVFSFSAQEPLPKPSALPEYTFAAVSGPGYRPLKRLGGTGPNSSIWALTEGSYS